MQISTDLSRQAHWLKLARAAEGPPRLNIQIVALEASGRLLNPERVSLLNALWRTPARLLRRSANDNGSRPVTGGLELARGPLEDMLKLAADTTEADASMLVIECRAAGAPLDWAQIRTLLKEPSFPVSI